MARATLVFLTTALAVLFGFGCLLAALFEIQGFGSPRDQGPRPLYLASLAAGLLACVVAPAVVGRLYDRVTASGRPSDPVS